MSEISCYQDISHRKEKGGNLRGNPQIRSTILLLRCAVTVAARKVVVPD